MYLTLFLIAKTVKLHHSVLIVVTCGILNHFQSGFRLPHSTQIALVRIVNDHINTDSKNIFSLVFLHLSTAFDTVDHIILLKRLK